MDFHWALIIIILHASRFVVSEDEVRTTVRKAIRAVVELANRGRLFLYTSDSDEEGHQEINSAFLIEDMRTAVKLGIMSEEEFKRVFEALPDHTKDDGAEE